jgi:small neutral amino acid transporter SnatA (MarC family)
MSTFYVQEHVAALPAIMPLTAGPQHSSPAAALSCNQLQRCQRVQLVMNHCSTAVTVWGPLLAVEL